MKKILRRVLALGLALTMSVGLLAGCGAETDPIQEAFGYSKDTVMMTVDGNDVTAEDLFFWMAQNADYVANYFMQMGMEVDWTSTMGGTTPMGDYVKEQSKQTAVLYSVVAAKADEYGYTLSDEDKAAYEEDIAAAQEQLGGEESYQTFLTTMLVTESGMERLSSVGMLYNHLVEGLCREGGEYAVTEEDLTQHISDNDLLWAKHILLMTKDMATGEDVSEEDAAAKKAQAEDLAAQLQAIEDEAERAETFDKLMNEHSEDTGLQANPDGYVFTAGEMVAEFEDTTRALAYGEVSDVVETSYGYHIIERLDPVESEQVQTACGSAKMDAVVQEWVDGAEVVTTETYDELTTEDFYNALVAYRETVEPQEEEEAAPAEEETSAEGEEEAPAEETPEAEAEEPAAEEETPAEDQDSAEAE